MLQMLQATIGTTHRSVILFGALIEIDSVILRRVDHSGKEPRDITTKPYWIRVVYRIGGRYGVDDSLVPGAPTKIADDSFSNFVLVRC